MSAVSERLKIDLKVNGTSYSRDVDVRRTLADFLRDDLGLTGTHLGCEHGACGTCTVTIDGHLARSCLTLAVQAKGASVKTVEGLAGKDGLHPLQKAFKQHHACNVAFVLRAFL